MNSLSSTFAARETVHSPDLLRQALSGDAQAYCALCRVYETRLFRQALALCRDVSLAEDLAQDTFVEAWKYLHRYHGRCRFFTWLCAILFNRYRNTLREKRPLPLSTLSGKDEEKARHSLDNFIDPCTTPDQTAERVERDAALRRRIELLPFKHREVVYMRFFVDCSLDSIAAALNCSVGTVKSRLFHALDKLRALHELTKE